MACWDGRVVKIGTQRLWSPDIRILDDGVPTVPVNYMSSHPGAPVGNFAWSQLRFLGTAATFVGGRCFHGDAGQSPWAEAWSPGVFIQLGYCWGRCSRLKIRDKTDSIAFLSSHHRLRQSECKLPVESLPAWISIRQDINCTPWYFNPVISAILISCGVWGAKWTDAYHIARRTVTGESVNETARNKAWLNGGPTALYRIPLGLNNF